MNILTDFYRFEKIAGHKSATRMDLTTSTQSYGRLEQNRAANDTPATSKSDAVKIGSLRLYLCNTPNTYLYNKPHHKKPDKSISIGNRNFSAVYLEDADLFCGFGDVAGTNDAVLFLFANMEIRSGVLRDGSALEMYIARGQARNKLSLYHLFKKGGLNNEIQLLRNNAHCENTRQ